MAFTQHVVDCRDHESCIAIVCTDGAGSTVWVSHDHTDTNPAKRINPEVPALDKRGQQNVRAKGKPLAPTTV